MLALAFVFALHADDDVFPLENDRAISQVMSDTMKAASDALTQHDVCRSEIVSPAADGCRFVRDEAYRYSIPITSAKDFNQAIARAGGMEQFRKRYGLSAPSAEQLRGPNASLPMGFTYNADKTQVHINCFVCHGQEFGGRGFEGGANAKLRLEDLANQLQGKSIEGKVFAAAMGHSGFGDQEGASVAQDMSLLVSGMRSSKTGDVDLFRTPGALARGAKRPPIPVYAPPWWNSAPGLRRATFYANGEANQSAGHVMQFAMASKLSGAELRALVPDFNKILACVKSKSPPKSPLATDRALVNRGRSIFEGAASKDQTCNCVSCHGNGRTGYPEKQIPLSQIKTDGMLAGFANYDDVDHHQQVLNTFDPNAKLPGHGVKDIGYVAPPLVALFTKPAFLHNHSVPTARELLCTSAADRAPVWSRRGEGSVFDDSTVSRYAEGSGESRYDTRRPGFGNRGHDYCKMLKEDPKACNAMIEYLKTL